MGPEPTEGTAASRTDGPEGSGAGAEGSGAGLDKPTLLAAVAGSVLVLDQLTKQWIVEVLTRHEIVPVLGDVVRLTYTHNFGAAFGIHVGRYSRVFFLTLAVLALGVLLYLFVHTPRGRRLRLWALSLITGGALGNIVDRIRYEAGVVDFLDIGFGTLRWPVFNVADMGVSIGAVLLVITFYREETRPTGREAEEPRSGGRAPDAPESSTGGSDEQVRVREG